MNLVKREGASGLIAAMLVWSVLSVLGTRLFLELTGNPVIGRGHWHIAHVLFGGIFMMGAMISILAFEGTKLRKNMAMLFGIGWGLFVDEVGKYVTMDNNYWFRPAIMIIYMSFVILFLIYRYLERMQSKDNRTVFYSVLGQLEELAENDLEVTEKKRLKMNLQKIIDTDRGKMKLMAMAMMESVSKIRAIGDKKERGLRVIGQKVFTTTYDKLLRRNLVMYGLLAYSVYYAIDKIVDVLRISTSPQKMMMIERFYRDYDFFGKSDVYLIVFKMVFDMVAAILFLAGARYLWSKKRLRGIRFFRYGLYVSILLGSIFKFYFEQLGAVVDVLLGVIMLEVLNEYRRNLV
jgi:hypothetical protein